MIGWNCSNPGGVGTVKISETRISDRPFGRDFQFFEQVPFIFVRKIMKIMGDQ